MNQLNKNNIKKPNRNIIAYETIKLMIVNNELKAGDIFSENALAADLGMSRTPIREAIKILSKEGFVEIHNGVGISVKYFTIKEIFDISEVRVSLEVLALHTAIYRIKEEELQDIISRWTELKNKMEMNISVDTKEIFKLDEETHSLIVQNSENEFIKEVMNNIELKIRRFQKMSTTVAADDMTTIKLHLAILKHIQEKELDEAIDILRKHIFDSLQKLIQTNNSTILNLC